MIAFLTDCLYIPESETYAPEMFLYPYLIVAQIWRILCFCSQVAMGLYGNLSNKSKRWLIRLSTFQIQPQTNFAQNIYLQCVLGEKNKDLLIWFFFHEKIIHTTILGFLNPKIQGPDPIPHL